MFTTTPLQDASLASTGVLFVATFIQFVLAVSYVLRCRSPHFVPGMIATVAFLFLCVSYGLSVADWMVTSITDPFGIPLVPFQVIINIETAESFFSEWADPALLLAIVFVIRDRYLAYDGKDTHVEKSGLFLAFMILSHFLALLILALSTASTAVYHAAITATNLSFDAVNAQIELSNRFLYASVAFYTLAILLLFPFSIVVKQQAKSDRIINATLFGIVPMLFLRAIALIILVIYRALNPTFGSINEDAFTLANITSLGFSNLIAICILCYFFLSVRMWIGPEDPAHQQYGRYSNTQQPFHNGVQLVAQYPGQWGYPTGGMQPQQGYVPPDMLYQSYPLPQGGYHPNQRHGPPSTVPSSTVPPYSPVLNEADVMK